MLFGILKACVARCPGLEMVQVHIQVSDHTQGNRLLKSRVEKLKCLLLLFFLRHASKVITVRLIPGDVYAERFAHEVGGVAMYQLEGLYQRAIDPRESNTSPAGM